MNRFLKTGALSLGYLLSLVVVPVVANIVLWSPQIGDVRFPITPTTIDGMVIGGTTPAAVHATDLDATGTVGGVGVTARFASPGPIGNTTPSTVAGTTLSTTGLATLASTQVDTGTKTATAVAGAATLNKNAGVVTSEALTTAGLADYTLTLTNSAIAAADQVMVNVGNGTNTQGDPVVGIVTPAAGSVVVRVRNAHATEALNGTLKIAFVIFKN